jgi:hypothetical protein
MQQLVSCCLREGIACARLWTRLAKYRPLRETKRKPRTKAGNLGMKASGLVVVAAAFEGEAKINSATVPIRGSTKVDGCTEFVTNSM